MTVYVVGYGAKGMVAFSADRPESRRRWPAFASTCLRRLQEIEAIAPDVCVWKSTTVYPFSDRYRELVEAGDA